MVLIHMPIRKIYDQNGIPCTVSQSSLPPLCCHLSLLISKQSLKYLNLTCTTIIFLVTNVLLCSEKYSFFVQEGAKIFLVFDS